MATANDKVFTRKSREIIHDCMTRALKIIDTFEPRYSPDQWLLAKRQIAIQLLLKVTLNTTNLYIDNLTSSSMYKEFNHHIFDMLLWKVHNFELLRHTMPSFDITTSLLQEIADNPQYTDPSLLNQNAL